MYNVWKLFLFVFITKIRSKPLHTDPQITREADSLFTIFVKRPGQYLKYSV